MRNFKKIHVCHFGYFYFLHRSQFLTGVIALQARNSFLIDISGLQNCWWLIPRLSLAYLYFAFLLKDGFSRHRILHSQFCFLNDVCRCWFMFFWPAWFLIRSQLLFCLPPPAWNLSCPCGHRQGAFPFRSVSAVWPWKWWSWCSFRLFCLVFIELPWSINLCFHQIRKIFSYYFFKCIFVHHSLSLSFWDPLLHMC